MNTEEQAREAAKSIPAIALLEMSPPVCDVLKWAACELSRRESERAERAKPIDAEWLESIGFEFNGLRLRRLLSIGHYEVSASPMGDDMLLMQDDDAIAIPHITTRGQLLDLIAALKGGG